ncbi:MAG: sigma 54-interacting transcriptional regulator [Deltaproteobacteria bacterium]|jgi:DNA-binding NtrC family response regulator/PAS domain-containing protein|nr:sigma 54-interacting transcriptional regulator [Deltaproteobacteria bacterium]
MAKPPHDNVGQGEKLDLTLSAALESLPLGVLVLDGEGAVTAVNRKMAALIGPRAEEAPVVGMGIAELLPEGGARLAELIGTGEGSFCLELPEMEGRYLMAQPLDGAGGGLLVTASDQVAFGAYYGALPAGRATNSLFGGVVSAYPHGLMMVHSRGDIVYVNEAAAALMGETPKSLEGHPVTTLSGRLVSGEWLVMEVMTTARSLAGIASCPRGESTVFVSGMPVFGPNGSMELGLFTLKSLESPCFGRENYVLDRELFEAVRDEMTGHNTRHSPGGDFVRMSPAMNKAVDQAARLARSGVREALVTGEPGTATDVVARFIHETSARSVEPYVRLSCARRDPRELEREIFGAEAGHTTVAGLLEAAGSGTVCLEDADVLPVELQKRIWEFLTGREYRRAGGSVAVVSETYLILTASGDPYAPAEDGRLFHGLAEVLAGSCVAVPPLRSRREDIVEMANLELASHNRGYGLRRYVDPAAADLLQSYSFPGNVRELWSAIHKAAIFSGHDNLAPYLRSIFLMEGALVSPPGGRGITDQAEDKVPNLQTVRLSDLTTVLGGVERKILEDSIRICRSTREMAMMLGISQAGVSRKLKKFRLDAPGKYPRK